MSYGVEAPTLPLNGAGSLLSGVIYPYLNYNKPNQILLGSISGGVTLNFERTVRLREDDGLFGPQLDADGEPMCRYDTFMVNATLNTLFLRYRLKKDISTCESTGLWESGDWSNNGGVYAADTVTTPNQGLQSTKITATLEGDGGHEVFSSDLDLTVFPNGDTSIAGDYIGFAIRISTAEKANLGETAVIRLALHCDAEETETNYFHVNKPGSALVADDWTPILVPKSGFTSEGSPDWSAIKGVAATVEGAAPTAPVTFNIDSIMLLTVADTSSIVPVEGGGHNVTDEGDFKSIKPTLTIEENTYIEDLTLVGYKLDNYMFKIKLKDVLADGNIALAMQAKNEVVHEVTFTAHYGSNSTINPPVELYEYYAA